MAGRFFNDRDVERFQEFNKELIGNPYTDQDGIVNSIVYVYKVSEQDTKVNMYGEAASGKFYKPGVKLAALVAQDPAETFNSEYGHDKKTNATFNFLRKSLTEISFVLEPGDIIDWFDNYWEIQSLNDSQMVGGRDDAKFSIQAITFLVRRTQLQIERVRSI